jgi:hypothetical protein
VRTRVLVPIYLALAAVVTWPLPGHLGTSLPYGAEPVATVPLFNLWTLRWNQIEAGHLFRHYWDAPLFHATRGAFAFSEPQPLTGLVFTPISWLSHNPVLGYNLVLLAGLVLAGLAGHRLARTLGAAPVPAATAGALALGLPFVAAQMGVLQLTMVFPLFLLIDAVVRWAPNGGRRPALEIGLWLAVAFLTCGYYGLFAAVIVGPAALTLARRDWLTGDRARDLALGAGLFAVLALPIVLAQAHITAPYKRSEVTIFGLSAGGRNFWTLPDQAHGAGLLPWVSGSGEGQPLYPGTVLLLLAVGGMVVATTLVSADRRITAGRRALAEPRVIAARRTLADPRVRAAEATLANPGVAAARRTLALALGAPTGATRTLADPRVTTARRTLAAPDVVAARGTLAEPDVAAARRVVAEPAVAGALAALADPRLIAARRRVVFLLTGLILARLLALGLKLQIGGAQPYQLVRRFVPGFASLRSPFRADVLTQVFLVALAAYALDAGWRALTRARTPAGRPVALALAAVVVVLAIGETGIMPVRMYHVDTSTPDWVAYLDRHPPPGGDGHDGDGDGVLAFMPFPPTNGVASYLGTVEDMLGVLDAGGGTTTVNGYSGLFPDTYDVLEQNARFYPNEDTDRLFDEMGLTTVVARNGWLDDFPEADAGLKIHYRRAYTGPDSTVFERR